MEDLNKFRQALEEEDEDWIREFFTQAKQRRDAWVTAQNQAGGPASPA